MKNIYFAPLSVKSLNEQESLLEGFLFCPLLTCSDMPFLAPVQLSPTLKASVNALGKRSYTQLFSINNCFSLVLLDSRIIAHILELIEFDFSNRGLWGEVKVIFRQLQSVLHTSIPCIFLNNLFLHSECAILTKNDVECFFPIMLIKHYFA